ncbi:MAG: response regulator [Burkholderiales bacterium]|nr:response regulator [Burkholderiales bacterium]
MSLAHVPTKCRILIVDDDRLILATLSKGLQQAGYDILPASSGEEGLRVAVDKQPDLAILDVRMQEMSGIELARHLREKTNIPFMFLSAYGDIDIVRQAAEHGAVGYLVKPVDINQIIPSIEAGLARAAEIKKLHKVEADLTNALAAGRETSIAIGVLMERHRMNRDNAFNVLREAARTQRRKINDIAADLVKAEEALNFATPEFQKP